MNKDKEREYKEWFGSSSVGA